MPAPYERVKCESDALGYLGVLGNDIADCLTEAFANIRRGALALEDLRPWRNSGGPLYTRACGHLIYASEDPSGRILVVSALVQDDDDGLL
ncbi:MAG: hypothetical protein R3E65_08085 [Steroidobacteraceae bacterium]